MAEHTEHNTHIGTSHIAQHELLHIAGERLDTDIHLGRLLTQYIGSFISRMQQIIVLIFAVEHAKTLHNQGMGLAFLFVVLTFVVFILYGLEVLMDMLATKKVYRFTTVWLYSKTVLSLLVTYFMYLVAFISNELLQSIEDDEQWSVSKIFAVGIFILLLPIIPFLVEAKFYTPVAVIVREMRQASEGEKELAERKQE